MPTNPRKNWMQEQALKEGMHEVLEQKTLTQEKYEDSPQEEEPSS